MNANTLLAQAVTFLFVPGDRPDRLHKALASHADAVIVDWEDAVSPAAKDSARLHLAAIWPALPGWQHPRLLVRINAAGTPWHMDDLAAVAALARQGLGAVCVPKAESVAALQAPAHHLGPHGALLPLVESGAGLDALDMLAKTPQVLRLAFGHLDFQVDLGLDCGEEETELAPVRLALVRASRRAGLPAPVDGVTADASDAARVQRDAVRALRSGFGGKLCIHPAQLAPVRDAFAPTPAQLDWAQRVHAGFANAQGGVFMLDGRMVDMPVLRQAERVLQRARSPYPPPASAL
ncbi:CoA ester lyase [Comamonadaceae bacterium OH2545_COT-014]|nr:CoA ester lyase [Comamonadaceae bacterium OH2545_COT-014]